MIRTPLAAWLPVLVIVTWNFATSPASTTPVDVDLSIAMIGRCGTEADRLRQYLTPEMLEEYERIQDTLKSDAVRPMGGIGFVLPGMLRPRREEKD